MSENLMESVDEAGAESLEEALETGAVRVLSPGGEVNQNIKQRILDLFKADSKPIPSDHFTWNDKLNWLSFRCQDSVTPSLNRKGFGAQSEGNTGRTAEDQAYDGMDKQRQLDPLQESAAQLSDARTHQARRDQLQPEDPRANLMQGAFPHPQEESGSGRTVQGIGGAASRFRMCPGAWVRRGVYIGQKVILMPCFVNVGAHIGDGTMIDSGVTVGSCAQIGQNCHISSNVVIAGVLEPIQATPVIVGDDCFIGAGCVIAEGSRIGRNCVLAAGCVLTSSTRVYDREKGTFFVNQPIPDNSVVVPGSYSSSRDVNDGESLNVNCLLIIKITSAQIKNKTSVNQLLRS